MRNCEHCAFFELGPNGGLNQCVRLVVHRCGRLVEYEYFGCGAAALSRDTAAAAVPPTGSRRLQSPQIPTLSICRSSRRAPRSAPSGAPTRVRARPASSVCSSNGSKLKRSDCEKITGSCGRIVRRLRSWCRPSVAASQSINDDLPIGRFDEAEQCERNTAFSGTFSNKLRPC